MKHIAEGIRAAQEEALAAKASRGHAFDHLWAHDEVCTLYSAVNLLAFGVEKVADTLVNSPLDINASTIEALQMLVAAMREMQTVAQQAEESAGETVLLVAERRNENANGAGARSNDANGA